MKRLKFTALGLLTLGVILSPVYAFEGIVYEATVDGVGTITICNPDDDTECLTMMDRNLGASVAGIGADADGYHYQRGNNYGFPSVGTVTSTTDKAIWDDSYDNSGYYSEVFIRSSGSPYDYWSGGLSYDNLWGGSGDSAVNGYGYTGGVVINLTGRQGPCPEGWHVPSQGEWNKTLQWWASGYKLQGNTVTLIDPTSLSSFNDRIARRAFQDDFKIPFAGMRIHNSANLNYQGSNAHLWSSSPYTTRVMHFQLSSIGVGAGDHYLRTNAESIRCFKNSVLSPSLYGAQAKFESNGATSVGKVLKVDDVVIAPNITRYGYEIIGWNTDSGATTAQYLVGDEIPDSNTTYYAITHKFPVCEETLDEIVDTLTICNPSNTGECLTLMDKNLGASVAGIGPDSDGCMYQWGNNYCFPSTGTVASTGTLATWDDRFNNSGYYGEVFITSSSSPYDYWSDGVKHDNLWGGSEDAAGNGYGYPVNNPTDRKGPCPEGYHVPSYGEWDKIVTRWTSSNNDSSDARIKSRHFESSFLIPFAGGLQYDSASIGFSMGYGYLWSSTPSYFFAKIVYMDTYNVDVGTRVNRRANAHPVRCFKDQYISPHSVTFLPNGATSVGGATPVLSCTDQLSECNPGLLTGCTTAVVMPDITRDGREILGWSTDSGATVAEYLVGETVTLSGDTTFYAITKKTYTVTFQKNGADSIGATGASCNIYNTQTSCGLGVGNITICNPEDSSECLTMMDRNLGSNSAGLGRCSYGNYFQWGNNYGFPGEGILATGSDRVDCTPYGIGNSYSSSIFFVGTGDWCQVANDNLWGGATDGGSNGYGYPVTNPTNKKGPCPEGYHVPGAGEWGKVILWRGQKYISEGHNIYLNTSVPYLPEIWNNGEARYQFQTDFQIPMAFSPYNARFSLTTYDTPREPNHNVKVVYVNSSDIGFASSPRSNSASMRCFKDSPLASSGTVYGQSSVSATTISRDGWIILGWDKSPNSTTAEYNICDEIELTGNTTLYAITQKTWTATFELNGADTIGSSMLSCTGYNTTGCTVIAPSITKDGSVVLGRSTNSGSLTEDYGIGDFITLTGDVTLYAITKKTYTATFYPNGADSIGINTLSCDVYNDNMVCQNTDMELGASYAIQPKHTTGVDNIGLFTICNPNDTLECLTMMDKNLGASVAGTGASSYGNHYQWGNNYGFPSVGSVTSTTTKATWDDRFIDSGYYSEVFIKVSSNPTDYWSDGETHGSLWGGANDTPDNGYGYPMTNPIDRKGPCPDGYHVPSMGELKNMLQRWGAYYTGAGNSYFSNSAASLAIRNYFLIPFAGYRYFSSASLKRQGTNAYWWSSSYYSSYVGSFSLSSTDGVIGSNPNRITACSVRCFKNTPEFGFYTLVYPSIIRSGWDILGWNIDSDATTGDHPIGEYLSLSGNTNFYAITKKDVSIVFDSMGGTDVDSQTGTLYSTMTMTGIKPSDPTRPNSVFSGWYLSGSETEFDFQNTPITGDTTLYAHWDCEEGYVLQGEECVSPSSFTATFELNGSDSIGTNIMTGSSITLPNIIRSGWTILGWSADSGATEAEYLTGETVVLSGNVTFYAITKRTYTVTFEGNGADVSKNVASCDVYNTEISCGTGKQDITICNPSNTGECLTMMDRNLGAKLAGTDSCSYGNYYQRGNNYGFPSNGNIITVLTKVDCTPYGIGNNYSGSNFILGGGDWCMTNNNSLWGGGVNDGYPVTNPIDRQGPCPDGYHVPSRPEWAKLVDWWGVQGNSTNRGRLFSNNFLMPFAGMLYNDANLSNQNVNGYYWTSTPAGNTHVFNIVISYPKSSSDVRTNSYSRNRAQAYSVRCFKNTPLNQSHSAKPSLSAAIVYRNGWDILGWSTNPNATVADYSYSPCDELSLSGDVTLYAITKKTVSATFDPNGNELDGQTGEIVKGCTMYNTDTGCQITTPTISNPITTTVVGYTTDVTGSSTASIGSNTGLWISGGEYYYAHTMSGTSMIHNAQFTGISGVGDLSCDTAVYNGDTRIPSESCSIIAPDVPGETKIAYSTVSGVDVITVCGQLDIDPSAGAYSGLETNEACITLMDRNLGASSAGIGCVSSDFYCKPGYEYDGWSDYESCYRACREDWGESEEYCVDMCEPDLKGYDNMADCESAMEIAFNECLATTSGVYGSLYQWGNNYGFNSYDITDSGTQQIDCTLYNPLAPFSGSTFIKTYEDYCIEGNDNMWGGENDSYDNNYGYPVTNPTNRQGPCPDGYHVPSEGEWGTLLNLWSNRYTGMVDYYYSENGLAGLKYYGGIGLGQQFQRDFKIPHAGLLYYYYAGLEIGDWAYFWSSTPYNDSSYARYFEMNDYSIYAGNTTYRANAQSIRCFKNVSETISNDMKFLGWTSESGSNEVEYESGDEIELTGDVIFYAVIRKVANVIYDANGGVFSIGTGIETQVDVLYGYNESIMEYEPISQYTEPTRPGYIFDGWCADTGCNIPFENSGIENGIVVYAKWICPVGYMDNGDECVPSDDIPYQVKHYVKDAGLMTYSLYDTQDFTGTTNDLLLLSGYARDDIPCAEYMSGSLTGDTTGPGQIVQSTTILPDGSTVIYLYYKRRVYEVDLQKDMFTNMVEGAGTYECGQEVQIRAYPIDGYHFDMWEGEVD